MSNQLQKTSDVRSIIESEKFKAEVAKVLPKHLTAERMTRVAITAMMKTPKLFDCTPESVLNCLMLCSQAGLEPDGRLAHLIPYGTTCQLILDYKGLLALAQRNGYGPIYADKVCDGDEFDASVVDGVKKLTHRINWKGPRGEPYAFYAVCMKNGVADFEVMALDEVKAIQNRSRAGKSGPWMTDFDEMGKKCPLRRMSKRWDLMPEVRDVLSADIDTPPPLNDTVVSKPLFTQPALENKTVKEPVITEEPTPIEAEPEAVAEPETNPSTTIKSIRAELTKAKVSEKALLDHLENLGVIGIRRSLEEIHAEEPEQLAAIQKNLKHLITEVKK